MVVRAPSVAGLTGAFGQLQQANALMVQRQMAADEQERQRRAAGLSALGLIGGAGLGAAFAGSAGMTALEGARLGSAAGSALLPIAGGQAPNVGQLTNLGLSAFGALEAGQTQRATEGLNRAVLEKRTADLMALDPALGQISEAQKTAGLTALSELSGSPQLGKMTPGQVAGFAGSLISQGAKPVVVGKAATLVDPATGKVIFQNPFEGGGRGGGKGAKAGVYSSTELRGKVLTSIIKEHGKNMSPGVLEILQKGGDIDTEKLDPLTAGGVAAAQELIDMAQMKEIDSLVEQGAYKGAAAKAALKDRQEMALRRTDTLYNEDALMKRLSDPTQDPLAIKQEILSTPYIDQRKAWERYNSALGELDKRNQELLNIQVGKEQKAAAAESQRQKAAFEAKPPQEQKAIQQQAAQRKRVEADRARNELRRLGVNQLKQMGVDPKLLTGSMRKKSPEELDRILALVGRGAPDMTAQR